MTQPQWLGNAGEVRIEPATVQGSRFDRYGKAAWIYRIHALTGSVHLQFAIGRSSNNSTWPLTAMWWYAPDSLSFHNEDILFDDGSTGRRTTWKVRV